MSDPKSFWKILIFVSLSNPVWFLLDKLFFKQEERQWVDDALNGLRTVPTWARNARLFALCAVLIALCVALFRLRRTARPSTPHNTLIVPPTGKLVINAPAQPLPVGTPSTIATAEQAPPQRPLSPFGFGPDRFAPPAFVNNANSPHWMQWEAARSQYNTATRFGLN
jgi:hypothetical protein